MLLHLNLRISPSLSSLASCATFEYRWALLVGAVFQSYLEGMVLQRIFD